MGSNKIREIENLDKLPKLTSLFLGKNRITNIKNLECLTNLTQVALGVLARLFSPIGSPK